MAGFGWNIEEMEKQQRWAFVDASPRIDDPPTLEIGEFDLGGLMARIKNAIDKVGARRVVLDSLSALLDKFRANEIIRLEMFRLAHALRELGVISLITLERRNEAEESYQVEDFVVDNVIQLRNRLEAGQRRRTVEILKFRGSPHAKGELPVSITSDSGLVVIPLTKLRLQGPSSTNRVSSGVPELDERCDGGFFKGSVVLVTGATGCGKKLLSTQFVHGGQDQKTLLFGFEESQEQLMRNANSWGLDFEALTTSGNLKIHCVHPEAKILEEHFIEIRSAVEKERPDRVVIDSLSALERIASRKGFQEFVLALSGFLKAEQITTLFTLNTSTLVGGTTVTEGQISSITDSIILLRYVELAGEIRRGLAILKMRGSRHDHRIHEFTIDNDGMNLKKPFQGITGILSGLPSYLVQERSEWAERE